VAGRAGRRGAEQEEGAVSDAGPEASGAGQAGVPHRGGAPACGQGDGGAAPGRFAGMSGQIPWSGWKRVLRRTAREVVSDRVSLVAAGCAFYAMLALFPAISMLIAIYGLVFDPRAVEPQLAVLNNLLPPAAFTLIADRVHVLVSKPPGTLTFSLALSTMITFWSAATGTKSIISALNLAYGEAEQRGFFRFQLVSLGMTLGAILGAVLGLALLVFLPAVLAFVGVPPSQTLLLRLASLGLLLGFVTVALSLLYRFGPSRRAAQWHWVTPGSLVATGLWLVVSALFTYYVSHLARYDATYGPLGAVVGVMMWFYVSAYAVLLGAELNAALETQTRPDRCDATATPGGKHGAYAAGRGTP